MQKSAEPCSLILEQNHCSLEWFLHSFLSSSSNGLLLLLFFASLMSLLFRDDVKKKL